MTEHPNPDAGSYPQVPAQPDFPRLEERILERWERESTFFESIARREAEGADEFVFYDGPPFANGLPHYGHLLTGFVKDAVPRYRTMRGQVVSRRFGWDCHGLPAEVEAEKELGISGHPEITAYGIAEFNDACRTSVLRYTDEWQRYVERQARWVDFDHDYKTLDLDYMESVMWAFRSLWDKGLIYEGFRVLAYCWRCETPLSNTETRMDDVYRDRQDPALTVGFELLDGPWAGARLLAWTTTPWTLPANLALAVGPDIDYAVVERDGGRYVLAAERLAAYAAELPRRRAGGHRARRRPRRGALPAAVRLLHRRRALRHRAGLPGPRRRLRVHRGRHRHRPPGPGVRRGRPAGLPTPSASRRSCRWTSTAATPPRSRRGPASTSSTPTRTSSATSRTPASCCATRRTTTPTRTAGAAPSRSSTGPSRRGSSRSPSSATAWSSSTSEITWVPEHLKHGSFGKWLENARDWSISRNRFWGSPIPVWRSDDPDYPRVDVYGSLAELEADFGVAVTDLHRPMVDELVRPNPDDPTGRSMMRRVPEVLDCWFESGSMPFAQVHYPFENREWFESHYPGDFIVEYTGQTRGWFYTLHVLATALFDRPAFETCVSHGIVLGADGLKMSKSLRNYPDPMEVFDSHGADAMRWYLLSSPILRGNDFSVTAAGLRDTARQVLLPLWNAWYFLALYANVAGYQGTVRPAGRGVRARARPLRAGQDPPARRRDDGGDGRLRPLRGVRPGAVVRRRADQLVHPPQPAALLGRRPRRHRHPAHRARHARAGRRAAAAVRRRGDPRRAAPRRRRRRACTCATGRRSTSCPPTTSWSRRWTRCATCARRRCRCARPTAAGSASRWPR